MTNTVINHVDAEQFASDVTSPPSTPIEGGATSLAGLKDTRGYSARHQRITLVHASGEGDVTLTGPVDMIGIRDGRVSKLGALNNGEDIVVEDGLGYSEIVQFVSSYDEFELIAAAVDGGGYDGWIEDVGEAGGRS